MYNFFSPDESELNSIIRETLTDNIPVNGETDDYIFRFPRNLFFAKMMIKDCIFCQFLRGKVSANIPDMQLKESKNRPFSMHKKIKGSSLLSILDNLSQDQQDDIIQDLSVFVSQLHALPVDSMPKQIRESLGNFLDGLASVHQGNYDFNHHNILHDMEKSSTNLSIIHGDFHPGNILIHDA